MSKVIRPIDTCPECAKTYLACQACGHCDRNLEHEGQTCKCGRGTLNKVTHRFCCQSHHHHLGNTCEHCGQVG